ncbi:MAG: hypothetical protein Q9191_005164 [Dirinaria sp. TL-2023a]
MDTGYAFDFQSPMALGLGGFMAAVLSILAMMSHTPKVDKKAPPFTDDVTPFVGSWNFFTSKMGFWRAAAKKSKTGNFSFWLGQNHIVGVSGEATRKMMLESRSMDLIKGIPLVGHGPDFIDGVYTNIHDVWKPAFKNDRTYVQRRLLDLLKSEQLNKRLPAVTRDARVAMETMAKDPAGFTNPARTCFRLAVTQSARVVFSDEVSDDPKLLESLLGYMPILQGTNTMYLLALPWLCYFSPGYWKRHYARYGIYRIVTSILDRRMKKGAPRGDDALQTLIDNGDSRGHIINYGIGMLFISGANAGILTGAMLNIVAHHADWQEKIYNEIKTMAANYSQNKNAPLVDQLDSIPLQAWESSFPSIELCYNEAIRMWVAFPLPRFNHSESSIPIPGTDEVIPSGSFAVYNTVDVHYNDKLYPDPMKWDPERFREGREEFKREGYGFMGWGGGRHPCVGMRWAKLQQIIQLGYALAMFKWSGCDANGDPLKANFKQPTTALNELAPSLPTGNFCKYVPREES